MRAARRRHRAPPKPPKPVAAKHFAACLQLLYSGETLTPERAAAVERVAVMAPYRKAPQGELDL